MTRLFIILFHCIALFDISFGQNPKHKKSKKVVISKTVENGLNPLKDTILRRDFAKIYGDSILASFDLLLNDTNFLKSINDTSLLSVGEFVSSQYKVHIPLKSLGWVSDFEHIFSGDQVIELNTMLSDFEKETTNEIAIVTIEGSWTTKENFDSFTLMIFRNWGVGKKGKNNGILIAISTELRTLRIQNGYGIEVKLSNGDTKAIMDDIIFPEFRKGNYFEGTKKGLLALMNKVR